MQLIKRLNNYISTTLGKSNTRLTSTQLSRLVQLTHFDKKELKALHMNFIKECPTGLVDQHQFNSIYQSLFPFGDPAPYATLLFTIYDTDHNGQIDFEEFISALSISSRGQPDEKLKWAFKLYDIDNDGFISRDEMSIIVSAIYQMMGNMVILKTGEENPELRVEKLFELMDKDNDGRIDWLEFCEGSKNQPEIFQALTIYDGVM